VRLLGLLPLATGAGILVLSGREDVATSTSLSLAIGLFGAVATIGLYCYELHGMKKCGALIDAGRLIEEHMHLNGQFVRRPHEVAGFIDEPFSASIIYPASLAGWVFFAFRWVEEAWLPLIPMGCFLVGFVLSLGLVRRMEYDTYWRVQYVKEPFLLHPRPGEEPTVQYEQGERWRPLPDSAVRRPATATHETVDGRRAVRPEGR